MIVVDLGCATYPEFPEDESVNRLIERFQPEVLYGFDPHPSVPELVRLNQGELDFETGELKPPSGPIVVIERKAAWVYDGFVGYVQPPEVMNPLRCYTGEQVSPFGVPCFDLARFLRELPEDEIVLKLDVESAEWTLLPYLIDTATDDLLSLLLVEWHGDETGSERRRLIGLLSCPVEAW